MNSKTAIINIDANPKQCTIKKVKGSRYMKINVLNTESILVKIPFYTSYKVAEKFIEQNIPWIKQRMDTYTTTTVFENTIHEYKKYKKEAYNIVTERIIYFNKIYNFSYNKIFIKNQRSLWGSCSVKGNLNFNYRIAPLPTELIDYLVVHEMCHLKEFNHSKEFWDLVAVALPNYKKLRLDLKTNYALY